MNKSQSSMQKFVHVHIHTCVNLFIYTVYNHTAAKNRISIKINVDNFDHFMIKESHNINIL